VGLLLLLRQLKHHIKYTPIVLLIILVYVVSKELHFPALLFILSLGLFLANFDKLSHIRYIEKLQPEILKHEVRRFKEITVEMTFLIRSLFFLLFGFMIDAEKLINISSLLWALGIIMVIYSIRLILLRTFTITPVPLVFMAPRGLITILLFLSIPQEHALPLVNESLIIQVIVFTAFLMILGMLGNNSKYPSERKNRLSV